MQFSIKPNTQQYNQFQNILWNFKKNIQNFFSIQIKQEVLIYINYRFDSPTNSF